MGKWFRVLRAEFVGKHFGKMVLGCVVGNREFARKPIEEFCRMR